MVPAVPVVKTVLSPSSTWVRVEYAVRIRSQYLSLGFPRADTGSAFTAQAYDISNIQGFTQSIEIEAAGCDTVSCTNVDCSVSSIFVNMFMALTVFVVRRRLPSRISGKFILRRGILVELISF